MLNPATAEPQTTGREQRPSFVVAFLVSAGLSTLFLVVYGGCNWITAHRGDVGTLHFGFERAIPFVPALILPYLSIDLFFVVAPFICRTISELRTFALRITTATLAAGVCFLIFPLRFAFERPLTSGWIGALFDWFRTLDAPYNLVPSLHAAYWTLLVLLYGRRVRGVLRLPILCWLGLVAVSPVLTYQHHLVDILAGVTLAIYCSYFWRERSSTTIAQAHPGIGSKYFIAGIVLSALAIACSPWGALLLWPAGSVLIVAAGYYRLGPRIFRKENGALPWSARFVLGPCLVGQYLSLLYYERKCRAWDQVMPNIWIGRRLRPREAVCAIQSGVVAVLDLSAEFSEAAEFRRLTYLNVPVLDLTAPAVAQLVDMAEFIRRKSGRGIVYVHCKIGYSRSAAAVAAYLLLSGKASDLNDALGMVRRARPSIVIRPEVQNVLQLIATERRCLPVDPAGAASVT